MGEVGNVYPVDECTGRFIGDVCAIFIFSFRSARSVKRSLSAPGLPLVFLFFLTVDHCHFSAVTIIIRCRLCSQI